jgi:hypothetical protein
VAASARLFFLSIGGAITVAAAETQLGFIQLLFGKLGFDRAKTGLVGTLERLRNHALTLPDSSTGSLHNLKTVSSEMASPPQDCAVE